MTHFGLSTHPSVERQLTSPPPCRAPQPPFLLSPCLVVPEAKLSLPHLCPQHSFRGIFYILFQTSFSSHLCAKDSQILTVWITLDGPLLTLWITLDGPLPGAQGRVTSLLAISICRLLRILTLNIFYGTINSYPPKAAHSFPKSFVFATGSFLAASSSQDDNQKSFLNGPTIPSLSPPLT